jgi:hypothetical protein
MEGASGLRVEDFGLGATYMPRQYSSLWRTAPPGWRDQVDSAMEKIPASDLPPIFFRADGVGAAGQAFEALCRIFRHHQVPLAMAVVPAWLSEARQERLFASAPIEEHLWGWNQHGWRHINWQASGKQAEFGDNRPLERQNNDILQGRRKMEAIFGPHFIPIFTPPWNNFSAATLKVLRSLGFKGISAAAPHPSGIKIPWGFYNFPVTLDLHTRNSKDPASDLTRLLAQLGDLPGAGDCAGIMIHHQRMTPFAFQFLDHLLYNLKHALNARFFSFKEILNSTDEKKAGARLR